MVGSRKTLRNSGAAPPAGRRGLSTERVLVAALHMVDTEGLDALSMRHLAHSLNREAMTLYRYAANKTALLDGVVELVLDELHINAAADDWRQELRTLAHDFRDLARAHPNVLPLVVTRPPATPLGLRPPGTLRPLEDFLQLLTRAGFTPTNALHAYRLFFGFLHGHVLAELQEHVTNPEDTEDLLRLGLHRLSPEKFPQLRTLGAALTGYDPAAQLDLGVDLMLTGLATYLQPTPPHPTAPA